MRARLPDFRGPELPVHIPIPLRMRMPASQIAAGALHSLAVTAEGLLLTWGWAGLGALGHGSIMDAHTPCVVDALRGLRMARVAGGGGHTLALSGR